MVGHSQATQGANNRCTYIGALAGQSGTGSSTSGSIAIGYNTGPNTHSGSSDRSNELWIDAGSTTTDTAGSASHSAKDENSLIYADQSGTSANILNFNAIVGIHESSGSNGGEIRFYDGDGPGAATPEYVALKAPSELSSGSDGTYTLTLPEKNTTVGTVLTNNGQGTTTWSSYTSVCFLPGTKITLSNNIKINIENLSKGDKLISYKLDDMPPFNRSVEVLSWFQEDTGEFTESEVSNIWSNTSPGYIIINDNLHVTHEHLIFTKVDDEYTWLSAKEIRRG